MLNERKLTGREVMKRETSLRGLKKNKSKLVKKYGRDAEKIMYGIATNQAKKKVEEMNKEKIREMVQSTLKVDSKPTNEYNVYTVDKKDRGDKPYYKDDAIYLPNDEDGKKIESLKSQLKAQGIESVIAPSGLLFIADPSNTPQVQKIFNTMVDGDLEESGNNVSFLVNRAFKSYQKDPNDETLREFNKALNKSYSTTEDRIAIKKELGFKLLPPNESNLDEAINPNMVFKVKKFVKTLAEAYGYSEQDAVYGIIASLKELGYGKQITNESVENPVDSVNLEVPLLIRLLEYSKEDAKDDMDLHKVAEKLIELNVEGSALSMDSYDEIVGIQGEKVDEGMSEEEWADSEEQDRFDALDPKTQRAITKIRALLAKEKGKYKSPSIEEPLKEYGEDSGGQDMTWGMHNRTSQKKDGGNNDFIKKGEVDYHDGVPFNASPYESGVNKYYKIDLAKYWKHGWLNAKKESEEELKGEDNLGEPLEELYDNKEEISQLVSLVKNKKTVGEERKEAIKKLVNIAQEKTGKPVFSMKGLMLALDYEEPSIREQIGTKGDTYKISKAGSKSMPHYVLEKPDGSEQLNMTFESWKGAIKFAHKNGLNIDIPSSIIDENKTFKPQRIYENKNKKKPFLNEGVDYETAAKLLIQFKPNYMYVEGPWLFHNGGAGVGGSDISAKYKGFGDSTKIKNLIWDVLHSDENTARQEIEKYTQGKYTVEKGGEGNKELFLVPKK